MEENSKDKAAGDPSTLPRKIERIIIHGVPADQEKQIKQLNGTVEFLLEENRRLREENYRLAQIALEFIELHILHFANEKDRSGTLLRPDFFNADLEEIMVDLIQGCQAYTVPKAYEMAKRIASTGEVN